MYNRVEVNDTRGHGCTIELRSMIHEVTDVQKS